MPISKERRIPGQEREEAPGVRVVETICRNIKVVEIDGVRKYLVKWKVGTAGVEGALVRKGKPVLSLFDTAEQVVHQHERVLERYLGTEVPLAADKLLEIPGETQKMAKISATLSSLAGQFTIPLTPTASLKLKERVAEVKTEIGRVTNECKLKAQAELEKVFVSEDKRQATQAVLEANLAILDRTKECLGIVGGTNLRLRIVTAKRNEWEETIANTFYEMAQIVKDLGNGVYDTPRKREQLARHISGKSKHTLIGKLNLISGSEYWQRIQSREVQKLGKVGDLLRESNDEKAKASLIAAILMLERVVKEKEERETAELKSKE